MISFYPGPSKVYDQIPDYVRDAHAAGILSINHRSPEFMSIFGRTVELVKEKLQVPEAYSVLFASSATECWEIICQSLVQKHSFHIYNGAFGEKWHRYATGLVPQADASAFDPETLPEIANLAIPDSADMVCITHNETSNGTALPSEWIQSLRQHSTDPLIAVDATSSMAGISLPWSAGDVWYASVQKCFGLPAGMAVLILSPRAVRRAEDLHEKQHYNSLLSMIEQGRRRQTTHTPNVLGVYLLMRTLEHRQIIGETEKLLKERYGKLLRALLAMDHSRPLISNEVTRSITVLPFSSQPSVINQLREKAKEQEITLGNGYGELKSTTLRIANFPAISSDEINQLIAFLEHFTPTLS
uniref:phosphoserine transaminase n=1 Tax=Roseihalotalea indica TaxID=2867963 RepID=A0AA49GPR4_9BACT|nr:aminotransferase class V-fold PLP-dependent enzyme [Tunicatimonas sp. TK19036]